jgi:hypothetical protein
MNWRSAAYKALRLSNDARALRRGRMPQRLARRAYGRATGRFARRLFK